MSLSDDVEAYLRGYTDGVNMAATMWKLERHDDVWVLTLTTENGDATLVVDKGGLQDLHYAFEREYYGG